MWIRYVRFAFLATVGIMLAACGGGHGVQMIDEPPADPWAEDILESRAGKDEEFRSSPDTPIHPQDRVSFERLEYWEPDPSYRFVGPIHVYPEPEPFTVITTTGKSRPCARYGWVSFKLDGQTLNLQVYKLLDSEAPTPLEELFLPFTDATSGVETYPAGRYVKLGMDEQGRYVLDFNLAHNPLCAYGMPERYACPVTPSENRLAVRVEAGERGYRGKH